MKIKTIIKNAWKIYYDAAKHFIVDAGITILCVVAVLYWLFVNPEASLDGAVAILFAYSIYTAVIKNTLRKQMKDGNPE